AAFRILATGEVLGFSCAPNTSVKTRVGTRKIIDETSVEVPCFFNPLTTALEPSNRVWKDSM
ncbi:hypothetical protein MKW94_011038, partial [Papaver nudicaule]|nr:hypothetical protein [Papaver nudicaule]